MSRNKSRASRRRIAVLSTSRADYGLLYWLLRGLARDSKLELQLIVCGSHLSRLFGRTVRLIRADGFKIAAEVKLMPASDSVADAARAAGRGTLGFAAAFERLRPDILVMLGDRFELLSAASAAVVMRLPIAHIHGGESSEGVLDEQVRHAVTKLSHLHFTAAGAYRRRVIGMGEDPRRVFDVGAPGLEFIRRLTPLPRTELERRTGLDLSAPFALATYHPDASREEGLQAMLDALDATGLRSVITYANADAGGRAINERIREYCAARPGVSAAFTSLGQAAYLSLARLACVVIGNSSSGISEAPILRVPTVNIGSRQKGRLRAPSIIDCAATPEAVTRAIRRARSPAFRRAHCRGRSVYGDGAVAARIIGVLKSVPLGEALLTKSLRGMDKR